MGYEVSLADLQNENDAERSFRKFKLVCEEVQGKNCLTNFHGMGLTTDKLRSMVKKWQTLIEATATSRPPMATPSGFSALDSHASRSCPPRRLLTPRLGRWEHPQEDDRHHQPRGDHHRLEGRRQQAHP